MLCNLGGVSVGCGGTCIDDYVALLEDSSITGASEGCVLVLWEEAEHVHGQRLVRLDFPTVSASAFTCLCGGEEVVRGSDRWSIISNCHGSRGRIKERTCGCRCSTAWSSDA